MKNYEVWIKGFSTVVITGVESEDEAVSLAMEEVRQGDFEIEEAVVKRELETSQELACARRRCNAEVKA